MTFNLQKLNIRIKHALILFTFLQKRRIITLGH